MKAEKTMRYRKPNFLFSLIILTMLLLFGTAIGLAYADEQEGVTIIIGTPGPDVITVTIAE